jgi:hypoxanthine phosphoribosyltransferase
MPPDMVPVLTRDQIQARVKALAKRIVKDYGDKEIVLIGILKGAFIFLADLVRELPLPLQVGFIRLASYGSHTSSSGHIRVTKDVEIDIRGRHVLIVEDIVDSGLTIAYLLDHLKQRRPESIKICALIDKRERRKVQVQVDYTGHVVDQGFLVGYGLDFDEKYRNLPQVYRLKT